MIDRLVHHAKVISLNSTAADSAIATSAAITTPAGD